ncbi:hypothetical protein WN51_07691 [Melipona quadrifasciata]|uniref:Uncharacterized protein n=1 Tax=Melipona quadrifasciata TaxID=166423 RepID=A0A0M9A6K5_9HYME|nr:hypothetical protein WN51_07691 [Melipona quadrifasciata]
MSSSFNQKARELLHSWNIVNVMTLLDEVDKLEARELRSRKFSILNGGPVCTVARK